MNIEWPELGGKIGLNNTKKEFDAFEKFLFTSSSESGLTYPKVNNTGSLLHTTSSEALSWYSGILGTVYTTGSARYYDYNNFIKRSITKIFKYMH